MWSAPRTWVDGELVSSAAFNTELRDNQDFVLPFTATGAGVRFPTFDALRFTALAPMTWVVASADVAQEGYSLQGKELLYSCFLTTTTLSGTASTQVRITLPDQLVCAESGFSLAAFTTEASRLRVETAAGTSIVTISRFDSGNLTLGTDSFWMYFTLACMVNR